MNHETEPNTAHETGRLVIFTAAALLVLAAMAGCQKIDRQDEMFEMPDEQPAMMSIAHRQAVLGAVSDSTLHEMHFNRGQLSSLGQEKLVMMLDDPEAIEDAPVLVFVAAADPEGVRREAVAAHLRELGIADERIRIESGLNPDSHGPAVSPIGPTPITATATE